MSGVPLRKLAKIPDVGIILSALFLAASLIGAGFVFFGDISGGSPQRQVTLEADGISEVYFTRASTVGEFLREQNIDPQPYDHVIPAAVTPIKPGLFISFSPAERVYLADSGAEPHEIMCAGQTVCDLLTMQDITIGPLDRVVPPLATPLEKDMTVEITRVDVLDITTSRVIEPPLVIEPDAELPRGRMEEVSPGSPGVAEDVTRYYFLNGEETTCTDLGSRIMIPPEERVARVGVRSAPPLLSRGSSGIHRDVMEMDATAYDPGLQSCWPFADGLTATGHVAGHGVCAVDPDVIPLGTELWIEGYGYALACDTGGAIKGNRIDLCFDTRSEALHWGRRNVLVYVLE